MRLTGADEGLTKTIKRDNVQASMHQIFGVLGDVDGDDIAADPANGLAVDVGGRTPLTRACYDLHATREYGGCSGCRWASLDWSLLTATSGSLPSSSWG